MVKYVIALYIRLSIEDSKVESMSIQNQRNSLHRYADEMDDVAGAEVIELVDNGYSGTDFERPAVQELLDMVRAGKVNCIIVKDFSRFGRNSMEVGYFIERVFPVFGIRFISVSDEFDSAKLHGDTGGLETAFKYLMSEYYSKDMSIKSITSKYAKMKRGEYQSVICPYGYSKSADGRMEPDPETADNVRFIFEMAGAGHSAQQIVDALFEKGVPTPGEHKAAKGKAYHDISRCHNIWQRSTVLRLLADERYTGTYIIGKREVTRVGGHQLRMKDESKWFRITDHHPAIIEKELFEQAQTQIRHFKSVKRNKNEYPLRGKVFCGCCRHAMSRTANKNHSFYCRYTKADKTFACHGLQIEESELEAALYGVISKQAQVILNIGNLADSGELETQLSKQSEYERQIEDCRLQKRHLYERLLRQEFDVDAYRKQKAVYDAELNRLTQVHTALAAHTAQTRMDSETRTGLKKLARDVTEANGLTAAQADALIERVNIYPGNQLEIIWKLKDFCVHE